MDEGGEMAKATVESKRGESRAGRLWDRGVERKQGNGRYGSRSIR